MTYHEHVKAALAALLWVNPDLRHTSEEEAIDHLREAMKLEYTLAEEIGAARERCRITRQWPNSHGHGANIGTLESYKGAAEALGLPTKMPLEPTA